MRHPPPAVWRALLRAVLPESERDHLMAELEGLHRRRVERDGVAAARRWYRREVTAFAVRLPLERGRRALDVYREVGMGLGRRTRQTLRRLLRAPGFTTVAAATLALGIGASGLILSLVDQALLRPLPYPEADRLVTVADGWAFSRANVGYFQRDLSSLEAVGGARNAMGMTLEGPGALPTRALVAEVNPGYLDALQVQPVAGRRFRIDEGEPGAGSVALLANGFARERYGSPAAALGEQLTLDARTYTVVGVLPRGFDMPSAVNDIWVPVEMDPADAGLYWGLGAYSVVGRMRPGATPEQVSRELAVLGEEIRTANPLWTPSEGYLAGASVVALAEQRASVARTPLLILLGAVGVLLLVVCANVANLLLSRALSRRRDHAVRAALGAGRGRMVADQLLEVGVLTCLGVVAGLGLAALGLELLRPHLPIELPGRDAAGIDVRVVALTGCVALAVALASGILPALRTASRDPGSLLRGGGGRTGTGSRSRRRTTRWLVAGQMAAAVVLVVAASLLGRSLLALQRVDPGFVVEDRVTLRVDMAPGGEPDAEARSLELQRLKAHLQRALGGVEVALASTLPFAGEEENMATFIAGVTDDPNSLPVVKHHRVGPDFFRVLGVEVQQGRTFEPGDVLGTELVAVVDRAFVDAFLPDVDPVGRIVRYPFRGAPDMRIVGVVESVRESELGGAAEPTWWAALPQMEPWTPGHVFVAAPAVFGPDATLGALSDAVRDFDERMALSQQVSYAALLGEALARERAMAVLLALVAASTLLLGGVGVYGVASFWVRERVRDIGVRIALGADPDAIRREVLREGLRMGVPGAVIGVLLALPAGRLLESLLYGVSPLDPVSLVGAPLLLLGAALAAVHLPARRATRVDPVDVLSEG